MVSVNILPSICIQFKFRRHRGSPRALEEELRAKGGRLRTLIKAGGLWYPNVNANTSSHFKVDRKHNKLSLVSMFGPSPDWVVGVSGLNLCRKDCTWEPSLDIDLYPWDSGTDSGISYMSPNAETQPRERMHKITTKYPEDPRAPFYNSRSDEMIPLAKLFIRRDKVIKRNCDEEILQSQIVDVAENDDDEANKIRESWRNWNSTCLKLFFFFFLTYAENKTWLSIYFPAIHSRMRGHRVFRMVALLSYLWKRLEGKKSTLPKSAKSERERMRSTADV